MVFGDISKAQINLEKSLFKCHQNSGQKLVYKVTSSADSSSKFFSFCRCRNSNISGTRTWKAAFLVIKLELQHWSVKHEVFLPELADVLDPRFSFRTFLGISQKTLDILSESLRISQGFFKKAPESLNIEFLIV